MRFACCKASSPAHRRPTTARRTSAMLRDHSRLRPGRPSGSCSRLAAESASFRRHGGKTFNLESGEWLVPRANTKTNVEWMVFLSDFAIRQFQFLHAITAGSPWCFPGRDPSVALNPNAISKQIGDRQFQFKNRKALMNRRNDNTLVLSGGEWTAHDLRRTGSTIMQSLGVPEHVRERCLNHVVGGKLGRVYGRYEFANEKREAWRSLGKFLDATLAQ